MSESTHPGKELRENPHSLRWCSLEEKSRLAAAVERALKMWERQWGLDRSGRMENEVTCEMAFERGNSQRGKGMNWRSAPLAGPATGAGQTWWSVTAAVEIRAAAHVKHSTGGARTELDMLGPLLDALFDSDSENQVAGDTAGVAEMAAEVAQAALTDLWRDLGLALQLDPTHAGIIAGSGMEYPGQFNSLLYFQPWSGAVLFKLRWCGHNLWLLLDPGSVERFLRATSAAPLQIKAPASAPVPVWEAVAGVACTVKAELQSVELSLGEIEALRVGDVIQFPHSLDAALSLKTEHGDVLCQAFLGKHGEQRAIELLRPPKQSINQ
jgi:hypothetical protein